MLNRKRRQYRELVSSHCSRLALLCLFALPVEVAAQSVVAVSPGSRVRISLEEGVLPGANKRVVGTLVSMSDESVVIRTSADDPQSFPAASVTALEVSTGRTSRALQGALIGGLALGTITAIQAYVAESNCEPEPFGGPLSGCGSPGGIAALGFVLGGTVGAGAGALIGAFIRTDRWLPASPGVRGAVRPSAEGLAISVSVVR